MGSDPDANAQVWTDAGAAARFARFARIRVARAVPRALMDEAEARGWPVVRPLLMHFPEDAKTHASRRSSCWARAVVAPSSRRGGARPASGACGPPRTCPRAIDAPWREEDEGFSSAVEQAYRDLSVPYGEPLVFYRRGSAVGRELSAFVRALPPLGRFGSKHEHAAGFNRDISRTFL